MPADDYLCSSPSNVASMPVILYSAGGRAAGPARWRLSRISRSRGRMSASKRVEFSLAHFAELEPHLRGEQLFAQVRVVVELGVDGGGDLVEHEAEAADQDRVEDEHVEAMGRSVRAFELQPDVDEVVRRPRAGVLEGQLVVALADLLDPSRRTRASVSRPTRNAAFMIMRSPIGLLEREATDTSRRAWKISAT